MAVLGDVTGWVTGFVVCAIVLFVGITILSGAVQDCSNMDGYDARSPENSVGWAKLCVDTETQTHESYSLIIIVLVVIAAVVILLVLRYLY